MRAERREEGRKSHHLSPNPPPPPTEYVCQEEEDGGPSKYKYLCPIPGETFPVFQLNPPSTSKQAQEQDQPLSLSLSCSLTRSVVSEINCANHFLKSISRLNIIIFIDNGSIFFPLAPSAQVSCVYVCVSVMKPSS